VAIAVLSMSLFHCYGHPNGKTSLHIAPDILCDSAERQELLAGGVAAILVYCVAGLALAVWVLGRAPRRFEQPAFRKRWRFLLAKYRPDVHWWSVVMLGRGLALSLAAIAFTRGGQQLLYVVAVLAAYGFWANYFKPWRHAVTNVFDVVMSVALLAAASAMMRFAASPADRDSQESLGNLVVAFTQVTNFVPQAVALVLGTKLVWQFFQPARQAAELRRLSVDLARVGKSMNEADGAECILECLALLPEIDRETLAGSLNILLSESQLRITNLRKSVVRRSLRLSGKRLSGGSAEEGAGKEAADTSTTMDETTTEV